jgi:hypothetical protein
MTIDEITSLTHFAEALLSLAFTSVTGVLELATGSLGLLLAMATGIRRSPISEAESVQRESSPDHELV